MKKLLLVIFALTISMMLSNRTWAEEAEPAQQAEQDIEYVKFFPRRDLSLSSGEWAFLSWGGSNASIIHTIGASGRIDVPGFFIIPIMRYHNSNIDVEWDFQWGALLRFEPSTKTFDFVYLDGIVGSDIKFSFADLNQRWFGDAADLIFHFGIKHKSTHQGDGANQPPAIVDSREKIFAQVDLAAGETLPVQGKLYLGGSHYFNTTALRYQQELWAGLNFLQPLTQHVGLVFAVNGLAEFMENQANPFPGQAGHLDSVYGSMDAQLGVRLGGFADIFAMLHIGSSYFGQKFGDDEAMGGIGIRFLKAQY